MNKTITFTEKELELIKEDIETSLMYMEVALKEPYYNSQDREDDINMANSFQLILNKIK